MRYWKLVLVTLLLVGVVACTSSGGGELEVTDAWGRTSPKVAQNGAFYMNIVNNTSGDEQLLSATTEACDVVELHEMYMKEGDVMGMREAPGGKIDISAGETVELKVGGLHVMCIGKLADFEVGDSYPVTLTFANAGEMEINVEIRDMAEGMDMEQ
ncbi:MAG: copper chaperone PCu(A)C [Chloroflexi bacterium]|nr:copper chaperone PCu(A)C [Chloroflexota bacterium]